MNNIHGLGALFEVLATFLSRAWKSMEDRRLKSPEPGAASPATHHHACEFLPCAALIGIQRKSVDYLALGDIALI